MGGWGGGTNEWSGGETALDGLAAEQMWVRESDGRGENESQRYREEREGISPLIWREHKAEGLEATPPFSPLSE